MIESSIIAVTGYWVLDSRGTTERDTLRLMKQPDGSFHFTDAPIGIIQEADDWPSEDYLPMEPGDLQPFKANVRAVGILWGDLQARFVLDPDSVSRLEEAGAAISRIPIPDNEDDPLLEACRESWNKGYQTCVDALIDLAPEYSDQSAKRLIAELAETLQAMKPSDEGIIIVR